MRDGSLDVSAVDSCIPRAALPHLPTALSAFSSCAHLAQLERRVRAGELKRPVFDDPHADYSGARAKQHGAAYLERLKETGRSIPTIPHHIGDPEGVRPNGKRPSEPALTMSSTRLTLFTADGAA